MAVANSQRHALVGRERERAALARALVGLRAWHGGFVLVAGEAGVGKTRLVEDALGGRRSCSRTRASWLSVAERRSRTSRRSSASARAVIPWRRIQSRSAAVSRGMAICGVSGTV
jgi:ABC-type hemin transport system ATPase subunit